MELFDRIIISTAGFRLFGQASGYLYRLRVKWTGFEFRVLSIENEVIIRFLSLVWEKDRYYCGICQRMMLCSCSDLSHHLTYSERNPPIVAAFACALILSYNSLDFIIL